MTHVTYSKSESDDLSYTSEECKHNAVSTANPQLDLMYTPFYDLYSDAFVLFLILEQSCDQKQYYFSISYTITVFIVTLIQKNVYVSIQL